MILAVGKREIFWTNSWDFPQLAFNQLFNERHSLVGRKFHWPPYLGHLPIQSHSYQINHQIMLITGSGMTMKVTSLRLHFSAARLLWGSSIISISSRVATPKRSHFCLVCLSPIDHWIWWFPKNRGVPPQSSSIYRWGVSTKKTKTIQLLG